MRNNSRKPSTTFKKWLDETNDTYWEICPFCKAYVKDMSYSGRGSWKVMLAGPGIHSHIAAEHGKKRMSKGNKYIWINAEGSEYQAWAKKQEESRLRTLKDTIRRDMETTAATKKQEVKG